MHTPHEHVPHSSSRLFGDVLLCVAVTKLRRGRGKVCEKNVLTLGRSGACSHVGHMGVVSRIRSTLSHVPIDGCSLIVFESSQV